MKLRTTFRGGDVLFEGDLPLVLRAIPAGARVTRAAVTLTPSRGSAPETDMFHEVFPISDQVGDFGLAVQTGAGGAILDLAARRTVEQVEFATLPSATEIDVQLDLGGMWMQIDRNGNPTQDPPAERFTTSDSTLALPNPASQRLRFARDSGSLDVQQVSLLTYPSNLTLRLGSLGPFWFRTGDLRQAVTTPDFADILQGFLTGSQPANGVYEVPFILHSDTLARLGLALEVEYHLEQSLLPPHLNQVALPFAYGAVASEQPAPIKASLPLNARVLPQATSAYVAGRFGGSRVIHGGVQATVVDGTVHVSPAESIAHGIRLEEAQTASAIDLHLEAVTETARLLITLQEDVGGKPWGDSLLAEPIEVRLERPAAGGSMWASAPLPAGFTFEANQTYWLIVNSADGEVNWAVEPADGRPAAQVTRDRGLSWRTVQADKVGGPAAGLYRLRAQPAGFRQPIKLNVGGHEVSLRDLDALGKVDFQLDLPQVAEAFNSAVANAVQERASLSERVANGDMSRWTRIERQARRTGTQLLLLEDDPRNDEPPTWLTRLVVTPDGSQVYLAVTPEDRSSEADEEKRGRIEIHANEADLHLVDTLCLVDLPLGEPLDEEPPTIVYAYPLSLAISPDGGNLFIAAKAMLQAQENELVIWKVPTGRDAQPVSLRLPDTGFAQLAVSPDCRTVYLAEHEQNWFPVLASLNAGDLEIVQTTALGPSWARVRVAYGLPTPTKANLILESADGQLLVEGEFPQVTGYRSLGAGSYQFRIVDSDGNVQLANGPLELDENRDYTFVVAGPEGEPEVHVLQDETINSEYSPKLRFVHASPNAPGIDVIDENHNILFENVGFNATEAKIAYISVSSGTYNLSFRVSGTDNVIGRLDATQFLSSSTYTLFALGEFDSGGNVEEQPNFAVTESLDPPPRQQPPPLDMVVAPQGQRAYVLMESGISTVDLQESELVGFVPFGGRSSTRGISLMLNCNGTELYAVVFSYVSEQLGHTIRLPAPRESVRTGSTVGLQVLVLDTAALDRVSAQGLPMEEATVARIPLDGTAIPEALPRSWNEQSDVLRLVAITPDSARLLVAAVLAPELHVADTATKTLLDPVNLPSGLFPYDLVVAPDGRRAFVLACKPEAYQVEHYDGYGYSYQVDRYYLQAVELDAWAADDWALTAGRAAPVCVPEAEKPTARLGSPAGSTGFSQVFPVAGGQEYELHFRARASAPDAEAEIFWLSEECGLVGEASVEIKHPPCGEGLQPHALRSTAPGDADRAELRFRQPAGGYMLLDDVSFVAPTEATANSDFGTTEGTPVRDPVTSETTTDPATGEPVLEALPQGWQVEPAPIADTADGVRTVLEFLDGPEGGVRLTGPTNWPTGAARRTAVLSQVLDVKAGEPFVLEFRAFPYGQPSGEGNAALELRWTGAQAEPVRYEIAPLRFDVTLLDGTVPQGATSVELAFSQQPGGSLDIVYAHLSQPDLVEVPITFLSEAPGDLTVVGPVVAYDLGDEPRPQPAPAAGAGPGTPSQSGEQAPAQEGPEPVGCRPTPPEDVPAPPGGPPEAGEGVFLAEPEATYCPCCEKIHFLDQPETVLSKSGMKGVSGTCPNCHASVVMYPARSRLAAGRHRSTRGPARRAVPPPGPRRSQARPETRGPVPRGTLPAILRPMVATPAPPPAAAAGPPPGQAPTAPTLDAIDGIGEARSAQLAKIGIDSVAKLARSKPERIAATLRGVSVEMAAAFIEAAKRLGFE